MMAATAATVTTPTNLLPLFRSRSHQIILAQNSLVQPTSYSYSSKTTTTTTTTTTMTMVEKKRRRRRVLNPTRSSASGSQQGLYSAEQFEVVSVEKVDLVLEGVRPYLIADGGNVEVVSVDNGVVSLKLQGACGSCPSSTTTMKMGIERVLKEKFGDAIKEICQVYDEPINETTVEAVNAHLDILRPAIKNYGGSVQVLSVEGADCVVKYVGPESIGLGIKAAIKEKFPDIVNVVLSD